MVPRIPSSQLHPPEPYATLIVTSDNAPQCYDLQYEDCTPIHLNLRAPTTWLFSPIRIVSSWSRAALMVACSTVTDVKFNCSVLDANLSLTEGMDILSLASSVLDLCSASPLCLQAIEYPNTRAVLSSSPQVPQGSRVLPKFPRRSKYSASLHKFPPKYPNLPKLNFNNQDIG